MDIIKLEKLLNGACIILIAVTFMFICITLGKAYRMTHEAPTYGKAASRIIEGKYTVIDNEPKPVDP